MRFESIEKVQEALAAKITSKEEFDAVCLRIDSDNNERIGQVEKKERVSPDSPMVVVQAKRNYQHPTRLYHEYWSAVNQLKVTFATLLPNGMYSQTNELAPSQWWVAREWLRYWLGVYKDESPILNALNQQHPHLMVIPDAGDVSRVLYTDSMANGVQDRKVAIGLGRLLRKLYPGVADEQISDTEASYRASMSNEIELLQGEDFISAYMEGPESCMKKSVGAWAPYNRDKKTGEALHPLRAYLRPEFALAVGRNGAGTVNARTIVWHNPADETDKRYVRVYGDTSLARRLERNGYKWRGFAGAKLNAIPVAGGETKRGYTSLLMPYVDRAEVDAAIYGVMDGDDILMLTEQAGAVFLAAGIEAPGLQVTGAFVRMSDKAKVDALNYTCPVTGTKFSRAQTKPVLMQFNGEWVEVHPNAVADMKNVEAAIDGQVKTVYVPKDAKTFRHGYVDYLRNAATLELARLTVLDESLYGPDRVVRIRDTIAVSASIGGPSIRIMPNDRVHVISMINGTATLTELHATTAKALTGFKVIARVRDDIPCYVAKDVPIVKTAQGRNAVAGIHPVTKLWNGAWVLNTAVAWASMFSEAVATASGNRPPQTAPLADLMTNHGVSLESAIKDRATIWLRDYEPRTLDDVQATLAELLCSYSEHGRTRFRWADDTTGYVSDLFYQYPRDRRSESSTRWMEMIAAARRLAADTSEMILVNGSMQARANCAFARLAQVVLVMQGVADAYIEKHRIGAQAANEDVEEAEDERFVIAA